VHHECEVAIVGMGCRFPGDVHSPDQYWQFMLRRGDGIIEVPSERWNADLFYDPDPDAPGRAYTRHGGFLTSSPWEFDPEFFGIAPREAAVMDPQQRWVLEVAVDALDDAGMAGRVGGRDVGVYIGGFMSDNQIRRHLPAARTAIDNHTGTSSSLAMVSNRLSYALDLRGPSMTIDTACSSSLVAIHQATQALVRGECEVALAGGVNVMVHPEVFVTMCKGRFLSPDGRCKSFDASADGYGRGEGAGVVVLKHIDAAIRDGDRIYAVIKGTGANQDGRTPGITVPSEAAQRTLAWRVCAQAGFAPADIGYVEAHGTGTAVGDPIEVAALGQAYGRSANRSRPLVVGSVKAAIGHLEAAAGVAGLIKAALTVYHRTIPPQAWLDKLNPAIPFDDLNIRIATRTEPFPDGYEQAVVAINGFGYGGTNAHVILAEAPKLRPVPQRAGVAKIMPVSGGSEAAFRAAAAEMAALIEGGVDVERVCDAAWTRRAHHQFRWATGYMDCSDLVAQLGRLADGGIQVERALVGQGSRPVFVFSGMGPQWWRMGRELLESGGAFARTAAEIDAAFTRISGWSIIAELAVEEHASRIERTEIAQPANFLVQVGLTAELTALGIEPAAIVGHSVGEVSAAYVSGALSLDGALRVSYHRGRLQARTAGSGGMLAVGLSEAEILQRLAELAEPGVAIAAVNGPASVTVSGPVGALEALQAEWESAGVFVRRLNVSVPYHSALMDPILDDLVAALASLRPTAPSVPLYSSITGLRAVDATHDAAYWRANVRQCVRFVDAINALIDDGNRVFLEVGPHPVLSGNIREVLAHRSESGAAIPTLRRGEGDVSQLNRVVGDLYSAGCLGTSTPGTGGGLAAHHDLPRYPWQRRRLFSEPPAVTLQRTGTPDEHPLLGTPVDGAVNQWETELSSSRLPWLRDHVVDGFVVLPGAAYLDAALSAARECTRHSSLALENIVLSTPLVVDKHDVPVLQVAVDPSTLHVTITSRIAGGPDRTVHCAGRIVDAPVEGRSVDIPLVDGRVLDHSEFYSRLAARGLRYGPAFCRVTKAHIGTSVVVATIDAQDCDDPRHIIAPVVVDGALQAVAALDDLPSTTLVPVRVATVRRFAPTPTDTVIAVARRRGGDSLCADITLSDSDGRVFLELNDIEFAPISPPVPAITQLDQLFYELDWVPLTQGAGADDDQDVIVVGLGDDVDAVTRTAGSSTLTRWVPPGELAAALRATGMDGVTVVVVAGQGRPVELVAGLVAVGVQLQRVIAEHDGADVRGVVVTVGGFHLPGDVHEPNVSHAALIGGRRSLQNEQPSLRWRHVDLEPEHREGWSSYAIAEINEDSCRADEIAVRQGLPFAPYLRRGLERRLQPFSTGVPVDDPEDSFELEPPPSRLLSELVLRSHKRTAPGKAEVEVRLDAIGLNYKDSMKLLGVLTPENLRGTYWGTGIGMEGIGVVSRVGAESSFRVGDRVLVCARDMFRRYLTVSPEEELVYAIPGDSQTALAGSFVPLLTAEYGLAHVARLAAGETVLIHGAAGGTGLAAIQVARRLGARIIASAGTDERRAFASAAGAHDTVNSRSVNYVDDVMHLTGGRGADVIFTSLPGEPLRQNLKAAAEFGRVVEIGKADIYGNGAIELGAFDRNLSFTAIDVDRIFACRIELARAVSGEVIEMLRNNTYRALPATTYDLTRLGEAFDAVARSTHQGRVVATLDGHPSVRARRPGFAVHPDATYLVTGGFGAFGRATANWLVSRGARHLVLAGRSGAAAAGAQRELRKWRSAGVDVYEACVDVTDIRAVAKLVDETIAQMPPMRGVFHAAGISDDEPISDLTVESLRGVMEPKVDGARNLHDVLDGRAVSLDAFVLFSSATAIIGAVPQIAYAAANAGLDALAELRRAQGKPALSVNWGALSGGGMAENSTTVRRYLELIGLRQIAMDRATELLETVLSLGNDVTNAMVADVDWRTWTLATPASCMSTRFADHTFASAADGGHSLTFRDELLGLPTEQRSEVLTFVLAEQVAAVLGIAADSVDSHIPLSELGLDSLTAVELSARIAATLDLRISALEFNRRTGLAGIARQFTVGLGAG
jgi:acyl transferase domain-containing protein/NADPH:quinone reductase-like Zn-dependent oxidoreductase/NADP-dependent 3-hydroxy acid dehydrogenase YdfG/acyl carrier protein